MRFKVAGFPVRVDAIFFLTMAFLAFASNREALYVAEFVVVAGAAVLIHELGHAFAFRRFGSPAEIVLHGFGGVTVGQAQPPRRSLVVSAAGPLAGFAAGAVTLLVRDRLGAQSQLVETAFDDMVFASFAWGIFNLLPILPLDGGGVMASAIRVVTGRTDDRPAHVVSIVTSGAIGMAAIAAERPFLAVFAAFFGVQNWQALGRNRDEPGLRRLAEGKGALLAGDHAQALAVAEELTTGPSSTAVRVQATELAAWAHLGAGRAEAAEAALGGAGRDGVSASHLVRGVVRLARGNPPPDLAAALGHFSDWTYAAVAVDVLVPAGLLDPVLKDVAGFPPAEAANALGALQTGLQRTGRFAEAARVGIALYGRQPDATTAYLVARALAAVAATSPERPRDDPDHPDVGDQVAAWLNKAAEQGWRDVAALDHDPNFESLRQTEAFRAARTAMEAVVDAPGPGQGA